MKKKYKIINSTIIAVLLVFLISCLIPKHPIEGKYTNEKFRCTCNHRGELVFKNGTIEMVFAVHAEIDGWIDKIGTYRKLKENIYLVEVDWRDNKNTHVIEVNSNRTMEIEIYRNQPELLYESKFSLKEYLLNILWKWNHT
ncbi:hypothetical protein LNTAR_19227 [Lentisphaera araneosa HTCC2155]|uniref:Lipoprotein n=1 Tax=Lentisphaera araneosa HTCC2155 TaxID=313628 RepID=A6DQR1_9BACT|nr:hypothetical protein [Lentisphaera araneosa]EDM25961.1 hypothetical protein LNTAR_19227 [Lentisphaera araneosa HTCC2155]